MSGRREWPLSHLDAFFVAYQEHAGILMQMAAEAELAGPVLRSDVDAALRHVVARWPPLGLRLRRRVFGLCWSGEPAAHLHVADASDPAAADSEAAWRNRPLDPFSEAPFQAWWRPDGERHTLAFRAHHSVADGELFFGACTEAVRVLARHGAGSPAPAPPPEARVDLLSALQPRRLLRRGALPALWREARRQSGTAGRDASARVKVGATVPGDTSICERRVEGAARRDLERRATLSGAGMPWLCAAAWARALHARNTAHGDGANARVSLEVPASLRARCPTRLAAGNFISPVVVGGDASTPLLTLARELGSQFRSALRRHAPSALPLFTWPSRYIPWALFRRLAVTRAATGFATTHFTWVEQRGDVAGEIAAASGGRLRLLRWRAWAPVCLHMGVALLVVADAAALRLLVNYRTTALGAGEAEALADTLVAELTAAGQAVAAAS
jgi:hypothetical protein